MRSGDWPTVATDFFLHDGSSVSCGLAIQPMGNALDSAQPPSKRLSSHIYILDAILTVSVGGASTWYTVHCRRDLPDTILPTVHSIAEHDREQLYECKLQLRVAPPPPDHAHCFPCVGWIWVVPPGISIWRTWFWVVDPHTTSLVVAVEVIAGGGSPLRPSYFWPWVVEPFDFPPVPLLRLVVAAVAHPQFDPLRVTGLMRPTLRVC